MRVWLSSLLNGRALEVALALALGFAAVTLASEFADVATRILAQHAGHNPYGNDDTVVGLGEVYTSPYFLYFNVGNTALVYGPTVSAALALALVALVALLVVRWRDRELGVCPFCVSRIPYESTHCAYCGSSVEPAER